MRTSPPPVRSARENRFPAPVLGALVGLVVVVLLVPGALGAPATPTAVSSTAPPEGWYHLPFHAASPATRNDPVLADDAHDGYTLLYGGCRPKLCPAADTWKLEGGLWTNLTPTLSLSPPARYRAAAAYDPIVGGVVVFGGTSGSGAFNDTWVFSNGAWSAVAGPAPPARSGASLVYDVATSSLILFGGTSATGAALGDTWSFAGNRWTNLTASLGVGPAPRSLAGFAYDAVDAVAVLFGGTGTCGLYCNDTWSFDGGRWWNLTRSAGVAPAARDDAAMAYDPGRSAAFLYGGSNGAVLSDTWTFSHGGWSAVPENSTTSPGPRSAVSASFDTSAGYLVLFGGFAPVGFRGGTFVYLDPLAAVLSATAAAIAPGHPDDFSVAPSGGVGPYNVSWNFGDGSAAATGPTAGHTFLAPGAFVVTTTVTDQLGYTASAALTVSVAPPALAVALSVSPAEPSAGQTVTISASATGGSAPYSYEWSGDVSSCTGVSASALSCLATASGPLAVSVTVADARGATAVATTTVKVAGAPGGLSGAGAAGPSAAGSGLGGWFPLAYLAATLVITAVVATVTYRTGRAREAARREGLRPLCYAVPAWSETPTEFEPDTLPPPER